MTDLISKLADSILALINAQPRSPTKAEIMEVFHKTVGKIDAPQVMVNFDWLQALSQRAQVAIPPDIAGSVGILPLRAEDRDRATAKRWADMFKADLERTSFEIMHRGSPGTEKDRENGGLSSLWGAQDAANPHPEATQAARETYAWRQLSAQELDDIAKRTYIDRVYTKDGRTLNVKVTEGLATALGIADERQPHPQAHGYEVDGVGNLYHNGKCVGWCGTTAAEARAAPKDAVLTHYRMPDGMCACGATEPDKC